MSGDSLSIGPIFADMARRLWRAKGMAMLTIVVSIAICVVLAMARWEPDGGPLVLVWFSAQIGLAAAMLFPAVAGFQPLRMGLPAAIALLFISSILVCAFYVSVEASSEITKRVTLVNGGRGRGFVGVLAVVAVFATIVRVAAPAALWPHAIAVKHGLITGAREARELSAGLRTKIAGGLAAAVILGGVVVLTLLGTIDATRLDHEILRLWVKLFGVWLPDLDEFIMAGLAYGLFGVTIASFCAVIGARLTLRKQGPAADGVAAIFG